MKKTQGRKRVDRTDHGGCSKYNEQDTRRYLSGQMDTNEIDEYEEHSSGCTECLRQLHRCDVEMQEEKESKIVERLLEKTRNKLKEMERERTEPLGDFSGRRR